MTQYFHGNVGTATGNVGGNQNIKDPIIEQGRNISIGKGNYNKTIKGNYYEQSGNFGIGHMSGGTIQSNAEIAGVINKAETQTVTDAATEIRQLYPQLLAEKKI